MRKILPLFTVALVMCGCNKASSPDAKSSPVQVGSSDTRTLAEMEAEYSKLREKNLNDCLNGSPEKIRANQELCKKERAEMMPLGNAIVKAEQKAEQQASKP